MGMIKGVDPIIVKNRNAIEGNFVMSLWKDPIAFQEYPIKLEEDLITKSGKFFYSLGYNLSKRGITNFDEITIDTFLLQFPDKKEQYEVYGGFSQISSDSKMIEDENSGYYYDELQKNNLLIKLYQEGFDVVNNITELSNKSYDEVYRYYFDILENIDIKSSNSGIKIEDLIIDNKFIENCNQGKMMGMNYASACPILNGITMGLQTSELMVWAGHSGTYKSSFTVANFINPIILNGNKACIISNEQGIDEFKRLITVMTLTKQLNYWKINRKKLMKGGLNEEEIGMLYKAKDKISELYKDKLFFASMFDYDIEKVEKVIRKKANEGCKLFLYDTFKAESMSDTQFWQKLVEDSKQLLQIARREDVSIVATYQLALRTLRERYLDATCLGSCKAIKEVCGQMIMSRPLFDDEYEGEKNAIDVYKLFKTSDDGPWETKRVTLDKDKRYIVVFIDKSRSDGGTNQIIYEINGDFNSWVEVGTCKIKYIPT